MKSLKLIVLAALLAAAPACKKSDAPAQQGSAQGSSQPAGSAPTPTPAPEPTTATPATEPDHIRVLATHKEKKPNDPVTVEFTKYTVTKASFDPKNLEGATATIELDPTSISTGAPKRDGHLQSPDYLNAPKFAKIVIDIANVKKQAGQTYAADAKVSALGVDKTYPVTFELVDAKDDAVKIRGTHTFSRLDFGVGKDPSDKDESVAGDLTIQLQLTLKKT